MAYISGASRQTYTHNHTHTHLHAGRHNKNYDVIAAVIVSCIRDAIVHWPIIGADNQVSMYICN